MGIGRCAVPIGHAAARAARAVAAALVLQLPQAPVLAAAEPTWPLAPRPLPGWLQSETDLMVTPEIVQSRWSSLVRLPNSRPSYTLSSAPAAAWTSLAHSPVLIDLGPTRLAAAEPQVYVRPQFALGGSSESLRGWLRLAGINAASCTAPLMKMHSSFAGSSSHAKVSLSAHCSVH